MFVGEGLIASEGREHKDQRRILASSFQTSELKRFHVVMGEKSREMVRLVAQESGGAGSVVVDIEDWASRAALDIIGVAALGRDFDSLQNPSHELRRHFRALLEPNKELSLYFALQILLGQRVVDLIPFVFRRSKRIINGNIGRVREIASGLVEEKRKACKGSGEMDMVSVLCRADAFSEAIIVDQIVAFLLAG